MSGIRGRLLSRKGKGCLMQILVAFTPDTPLSLATHLVNEFAEQVRLFNAGQVVVRYDEGEAERMMDVGRNRVQRIK